MTQQNFELLKHKTLTKSLPINATLYQQHQRVNIQMLNCNSASFLFLFETTQKETAT